MKIIFARHTSSLKRIKQMTLIVPFETMFAIYSAYSGITGIFRFGIVSNTFQDVVGSTIADIFNILYFIAGLAMFFGIGLQKKHFESFGIIIVATSALIRTIALAFFAGLSPAIINSYFFSVIFTLACYIRLKSLLRAAKVEKVMNKIEI